MVSLDEWSIDELMRALEKPEEPEEREFDCLTIGDREVPAVYFHLPEEPNGFLSNWYPAEMELNGIRFCSAEQFIMYSKARWMGDREAAKAILCEKSPEEQQKLGRGVQGYHEQVWEGVRQTVVMRALHAKFSQNEELRKKLLNTGDAYLVECAYKDVIWACGWRLNQPERKDISKWRGKNQLGFALMTIREMLRRDWKEDLAIYDETLPKNRYPCHVYERSGGNKGVSIRVRHVKDYGSEVYLANGEELHINYIDELADTGKRSLERCADCGALMLVQELFCGGTFVMDGPFYGYDFIPVQSEEEADLLNILLDGDEFCEYPVRHIRARDSFMWWVGEGEPRPNDPEELKEKIRNKYQVTIEEKPVVTTNTDGSEQESGRKEYILKSIHGSAKKVKKGRRNLLGEERRRSREQIMGYIRFTGREGAQMKDICEVFQEYTPTQIRGLVRELNDENQIYLEGQSHNARWVEIKYKRYKALRDAADEGKKRR